MKKLVYIVFGFCAILASCAKEIDPIPAENPGQGEQVTPRLSNIPASITAEYSEPAEEESAPANAPATKTSYPGGVFSWVLNDEVAVYYVDDATTPTKQGWYAYNATTLGSEGATAQFTIADGQGTKITAMDGWSCSGIAVYPSRAAQPGSGSSTKTLDANYKNKVYVKVPQQVSGAASDIMLIGTTPDPSVPTSFKFRTAMAVLKVTVTGIPAQAKQLRLYTSDKSTYPLNGDFLLNKDSEGNYCITSSDYRTWTYDETPQHSANDYIYATISTDVEIASRDFYFNIPVGNYAKGAFSLKLVDGSGNALLEKTLNKPFDFNRNDLVNTPALANEWVTLGDAKFHDMFYLDNVKLDSWNWATTALQRNVSDNNKYRLVKPYQAYSAANSYTPLFTPDDYLYFTVNPENDLVSFERHLTGQTFSSKQYVISHTDKSGGHMYTQAYSKVVSKDGSGNPLCVQLAPYYLYSDLSNGYSRTDKDGMIIILFPDFDDSCSLSSPNDPVDETVTIKAAGTNISTIKVGISSSSASAAMSAINTNAIGSLPGTTPAATGVELSDVTATGKYYIAVKGYDAGGREIYRNTSNIYHITSADLSAMSGTYYIQNTSSWPLTMAMSTNIFMGNLAFTSYSPWSLTGNIAGYYSGTSFVVDATQVFNQHSNLNYYGLYNPMNANTIDPMTFTVSTVEDKKRLAISGIGVGIASMSGERATSYTSTSIYFSASPVLYQQ